MSISLIKIGTRDSPLAVWQAKLTAKLLAQKGFQSELVFIKSPADLDLKTPLNAFGTTGIFTKMLDVALLENKIDVAVHSLKDYPTVPPEGICLDSVLERAESTDILVPQNSIDVNNLHNLSAVIATGSIRRKAQWLNKYPNHQITGLRGNVQTRLNKLHTNNWHGAIFAKAGLKRVDLLPENAIDLDWMIPAPAQGVIGISCRANDDEQKEILNLINDVPSQQLAIAERQFLNTLEGGCSAPIGALATHINGQIKLQAALFQLDGSLKIECTKTLEAHRAKELGHLSALEVLNNGGKEIMESLKGQ